MKLALCILVCSAALTPVVASAAPNVSKLAAKCEAGDAPSCRELAGLATSHEKWETRAAAAAVIREPAVLAQIASRDESLRVRRAALSNPALADKARDIAPFADPEITRSLQDRDLLARIVRTSAAFGEVRHAAVRALEDRDQLAALAADPKVEDWARHLAEQHLLALEPRKVAVLLIIRRFGDGQPDACANGNSIHLFGLWRVEGDRPAQPHAGHQGMVSTAVLEEGPMEKLFLQPGDYETVVGLSVTSEGGGHVAAGVRVRFAASAGRAYCIAGGTLARGSWSPQVIELSDVEQLSGAAFASFTIVGTSPWAANQSLHISPGRWVEPVVKVPPATPASATSPISPGAAPGDATKMALPQTATEPGASGPVAPLPTPRRRSKGAAVEVVQAYDGPAQARPQVAAIRFTPGISVLSIDDREVAWDRRFQETGAFVELLPGPHRFQVGYFHSDSSSAASGEPIWLAFDLAAGQAYEMRRHVMREGRWTAKLAVLDGGDRWLAGQDAEEREAACWQTETVVGVVERYEQRFPRGLPERRLWIRTETGETLELRVDLTPIEHAPLGYFALKPGRRVAVDLTSCGSPRRIVLMKD